GLVILQVVRRGPGKSKAMHHAVIGVFGFLMLVAATAGLVRLVRYADLFRVVAVDVALNDALNVRVPLEKSGFTDRQPLRRKAMDYWERPLNLVRADLKTAWLVAVRLRGAELAYANLHEANLTGANLTGAHLGGADLTGANLTRAILAKADIFALTETS